MLAQSPVIIIGEGYATCSTVSQATGMATVCAMDCGNLVTVAEILHEKYPNKPKLIVGDDDHHVRNNPGKTKALEAAACVGGYAVFPQFAPGEQALQPKEFTDFNDLAKKTQLGPDAFKEQLNEALYILKQQAIIKATKHHGIKNKIRASA